MDGTLWDSTEVVARAWNAALRQVGLQFGPLTAADIASIMGLTHEQIRERLFSELASDSWERFSDLAYLREEEFLRREGAVLYAGVAEGLTRLAQSHPLAIVSNCQKGYIEVFLDWTGLRSLFCDWECHGQTGLSKGENLKLLCGRQNWTEALYVGDTAGDEKAAQEAGCDFLFAAYGFGQASPAAPVLSSFDQLLSLVPA
ncbi:MAG: HAD family hydrolase [Candidatus Eremiobacteraeota bacterium]|nr:HAD family hydrolase [Candidatus Eremiobacteraeota bacterium]